MLHILWFSACTLVYIRVHIHVQSCTCQPDGFCIAPDTIAYAKVSGADSIAWRTQLHQTPVLYRLHQINVKRCSTLICLAQTGHLPKFRDNELCCSASSPQQDLA